jgi:hypothetical protein
MGELDQREQAAVTASQVQDAGHRGGQEFQQCLLAFGSVRDRIGARQIFQRVCRRSPVVDPRAVHMLPVLARWR